MHNPPEILSQQDPVYLETITAAESSDSLQKLAFYNSIQANIITIAASGKIIIANKAAGSLLGYSDKEILNQYRSTIFDISETRFKKMLKQRLAEGHAVAMVTAIKKNGNTFPCKITSTVFMDQDGIEKAITTIADESSKIEMYETIITSSPAANKQLNASSEKLRRLNEKLSTSKAALQHTYEQLIKTNRELFNRDEEHNSARLYAEAIITTVHEPLLVLNHDFKIKSANEAFYKAFKLTPEQTLGNIIFELENNGWHIPGLQKQLLEIQQGNETFNEWEVTYTFPSAGKRTICFKAKPFQKENSENRLLLAFDDITLRKEKENAAKKNTDDLIKLLENMPQITLTASADGTITYVNKYFLNYSGMTFNEAIRKGWKPVIKPDMLDEFKKTWSQVIETGEDFNMELQLKRKGTNTYRWHLYRASAIRNEEGIITSWVGAATDLHDQKTREQGKDEFISIASHELKTPLTTTKAYIQLLEMVMAKTNNKDLVYVKKASESINRLSYLISELLDVSKIQNGKLGFQITTFDFSEMISAAINDVQFACSSHTIIEKGKVNQQVKGDKGRLQQVVINLLSNAIKYSPGAKKVYVGTALKNGEVKVSIKDRGIGIRRENLWKIFERYYREEDRAVHFQGMGIGLYISYEIIQRHNGRLWAEANGGSGTTFHFTLPV